ncbi:secondary thiamine-phosphate synthase enzyme [candidate division TA06 bacterium B3_TA06]|uniref:Secondary thiamine-phosphate synthase enzyme n=1 Tax=candidate division TA06 bacterium B3_TA06 TaxID=2012487 RepID=A0A532VAX4_UNCT6|nr:MAG: secondary thiamine-phosphate synthase enzyme [candidate division TA06 bacterium B3_TA06]
MAVFSDKISLSTKGFCDVHDITPRLRGILTESGLQEGICCVILAGSTGGITTIEYEPGVLKDLCEVLEKITPSDKSYHHDAAWGDGNGFSHLRSALIGASASIPFSSGKLILGTWQQVVFLDFDNRPRERTLHVQLVGEK